MTPSPSWKWRGEADHLDDHLVARPGVAGARVADKDRPREKRPVDGHQGRAALLEVGADEAVRLPLEDLDDPSPGSGMPSFVPLAELDDDRIARGGVGGVLGGNIDVGRSRFRRGGGGGPDEAESALAPAEQTHDPASLEARQIRSRHTPCGVRHVSSRHTPCAVRRLRQHGVCLLPPGGRGDWNRRSTARGGPAASRPSSPWTLHRGMPSLPAITRGLIGR